MKKIILVLQGTSGAAVAKFLNSKQVHGLISVYTSTDAAAERTANEYAKMLAKRQLSQWHSDPAFSWTLSPDKTEAVVPVLQEPSDFHVVLVTDRDYFEKISALFTKERMKAGTNLAVISGTKLSYFSCKSTPVLEEPAPAFVPEGSDEEA